MSHDSSVLQGHMMPESAVVDLLKEQGVGTLSMATEGSSYGIPISFGYDESDTLYFLLVGHSEEGKKVTYAERTEEASFLVYDVASKTEWRSVIATGPLSRITPTDWERARTALADNAYRPDLLTEVDVQEDPRVWELDIESKSGRVMEGG